MAFLETSVKQQPFKKSFHQTLVFSSDCLQNSNYQILLRYTEEYFLKLRHLLQIKFLLQLWTLLHPTTHSHVASKHR